MSDETAAPEPAPLKRTRAQQDQTIASRINERRTSLTAIQNDAQTVALLQLRGYDAEALAAGLALCDAAQAAFTARQNADAELNRTAAAAKAAKRAAREGFGDFRKIARVAFKKDAAAQTALGTQGRTPQDREKFLTAATATFAAALNHDDYLSVLSRRGCTRAALEAELANLTALTRTSAAVEIARSAAKRATLERDAAVKALDDWWGEFRIVAQVALKNRPDLSSPLKL